MPAQQLPIQIREKGHMIADVTEAEVKAFAGKVEAFAATLSPKERELLGEVVRRAAATDETQGYATMTEYSMYSLILVVLIGSGAPLERKP